MEPQPDKREVPSVFCVPTRGVPHPLSARCVDELLFDIRGGRFIPEHQFHQPGGGKMFGVLAVKDSTGRIGFLRGASGMLGGQWTPPGFVPPLFDMARRQAFWPAGEAELTALGRSIDALPSGSRRAALIKRRAARSRVLLRKIQDTYSIVSRGGNVQSLRGLFAPDLPPGGSGDCAAPKLLGYANAHGLLPVALAEFWHGASTRTGTRHAGRFYAPCERKCRPIVSFMLQP